MIKDLSSKINTVLRKRAKGDNMPSMTITKNGAEAPTEFRKGSPQQQAREADERHRPILDALRGGKTQTQVAQQFGITPARVNVIVKRAKRRGLLTEEQ